MGAFLRFHELGRRSFWFDEAVEVLVARAPPAELWSTALAHRLPDPPLASLLSHLMLRIGEDEFIVRFPYALLGSVAVYAGYHLFRLWLSPTGALLPQALLAFAPAQVYYAQEVGQYALMVLMSILIIWSFERALRQPNRDDMALFTLFSAVGMLVHYGIYWLLGGLALSLLVRRRPRTWLAWWLVGVALAVVTILIVVFVAWPQYQILRADYPPTPIFTRTEPRFLYDTLLSTAHLFSDFDGRWDAPGTTATWLFLGAFFLGLIVSLRKATYRPPAAVFFIALLLVYLVSKMGLYLWGMRYLLFLSPLFYLLLAVGLSAITRVRVVGPLVPLLALGLLMVNQTFIGWPNEERGEDIRPIIKHIQLLAPADIGIYVHYGAVPAFELYYKGPWNNVRQGAWLRSQPVEAQMADVLPTFTAYPESWFIASHYRAGEVEGITAQLDQHCRRAETLQESNALAVRYICDW